MNAFIINVAESLRNPNIKAVIKISNWENRNGLVLIKKHELIEL